jgi:hypothetical protein
MKLVWGVEVQLATERRDWERVVTLGNIGLDADPVWEEAFLELSRACRMLSNSLVAIERGRQFVTSLQRTGTAPSAAVRKELQDAEDLHRRLPIVSAPWELKGGGELISDVLRESGSVAESLHATAERDRFDVFLSAPMDSLVADAYTEQRGSALKIVEALRQVPGCGRVFYAGESRPAPADYEDEAIALRENLYVLRSVRFFVMIYPRPLASSIVLETGFALLLNIPGVICVQDRKELPFLLRCVTDVFPAMQIRRYTDLRNLIDILREQVRTRVGPTGPFSTFGPHQVSRHHPRSG